MKKYLKHFAVLFVVLGVLLIVFIGVKIATGQNHKTYVRTNSQTEERVYDYADKLTDEEEEALRKLIAEKEPEIGCDIVLMTINDSSVNSDYAMMNYADDFYDNNQYGYNAPWGDGAIYLDNWANGYCWFSTCGRVETEFSSYEIDELIDKVCANVNQDPYGAYVTYVNELCRVMSGEDRMGYIPFSLIFTVALVVTIIYIIIGLYHNKGKKTTTANTYVAGGRPVFNDRRDVFVTKHTTSRRIERSSSHSSGGGGHHVSSGGHSHGGGGGRH